MAHHLIIFIEMEACVQLFTLIKNLGTAMMIICMLIFPGFEAMQLLKCLNLSYNKFRSFIALEPLRLIRSLSVLDISFNEIGSHSIDTSRYLCSSPLPHSTDASWTLETCGTGYVGIEHCWEAAVTFKDMNLVQLNVAGNAIREEKFMKFLRRILPSLKWLDGVEIQ